MLKTLVLISEARSYYGAQSFALHSPRASVPLVTCSSPHRTSKEKDTVHPPRHFILTLGDDFTTHGFLFKDEIYHFLGVPHMVRIPNKLFSLFS